MTGSSDQSQSLKVLGAAVLPYVLCIICYATLNGRISGQVIRNEILEVEDARLSRLVREVSEIYHDRQRLLEVIRVYELVREDAPLIVPVLNVLSLHVPDDLTINTLNYSEDMPGEPELHITGEAETKASIERFLETLKPSLKSGRKEHYTISIGDVSESGRRSFEMRVLHSEIISLYDPDSSEHTDELPD